MNRYSDEDLKKARTLINDHAGIHKNDLETTLDLIGPELNIYPQEFVPDTSHITEQPSLCHCCSTRRE